MSSGSSSPGSRSMSPQPVRHEVLLGASVPHSPFHSPFHPSPIPFPDIHDMATLGSGGRNNHQNFSRHFPIHRIPRNSPRPNNKHHKTYHCTRAFLKSLAPSHRVESSARGQNRRGDRNRLNVISL